MEEKCVIKEKFKIFCQENPLGFEKEQLEKIEEDILHPRDGVVYDEYVEFVLWGKGLQSRQEYFAECVEKLFPVEKYKNLLEVGAGRKARLSKILAEKGYAMTAMDPKIIEDTDSESVNLKRDAFLFGKTDVLKYDAVIAQEPCEATEHIIRECVEKKKEFFISLCGTAHVLMNGEMPEDVYEWYQYLDKISGEDCFLIRMQMIPGYASYVIFYKK